MTDTPAAPPSVEEITAALQTLQRHTAHQQAVAAEHLPAIQAFVRDKKFAALNATARELHDRLPESAPFRAHLKAMLVGMDNLTTDVATLSSTTDQGA